MTQRKSFAYAIQQVQRLHQDSEQWNRFKQTWQCGPNDNGESPGDGVENDEKDDHKRNSLESSDIHFVENENGSLEEEEKKDTKSVQGENMPSKLSNEVRRALLRVSQVQEWVLVEKNKEIENLKKLLEDTTLANDVLRRQFEERNAALQETVVELQSKVLKQEKTINHELKTIRSIATKRAGTRTTTKFAQVQQLPDTSARRAQVNDASARSLSVSLQAEPPRLPSRKASERDGKLEIGVLLDVASSDIAVVAAAVPTFQKEEPPKLPIRQSSSPQQVKKIMSTLESTIDRTEGETRHDVLRKVSFTNQQNNTPPSLPQRQASQQTDLIKEMSDVTESIGTPFIDASTNHFGRSETTLDTHTDEIILATMTSTAATTDTANIDGFCDAESQQHISPAASNIGNSSFEGDADEGIATKTESDNIASQEISFIPTDFELNGSEYHPPPPSCSPHSRKRNAGSSKKNRRKTTSSQEIQFDASAAFLEEGDLVRNPSVSNMHFDASHQLLLEASMALSSSVNRTPYSQKHRKTAETSPTLGEPKHEIDLGGASRQELEFDAHQVDSQDRDNAAVELYESVKDKTEEELIQEKIFGNGAIASDEDEEDDNYDFFGSLPSELPVGSDRFLECNRSVNLSPVSALTTGSYLFDSGGAGVEDDEACNDGPRKALHQSGFIKQLPLEENFDSDDEEDGNDTNHCEHAASASPKIRKVGATNVVSKHGFPKKKLSGPAEKPSSKTPRRVIMVENQIVHDKYGDGGMYSGHISTDTRLPHGFGRMKYENGREYEGDWKGGRWHGFGRWINPNHDIYEGTFVYDARHGSGTYTWKNGNKYSGDFFEDKRQGKGTFNFANGNTYVGDFVNGVFEGKGKYTFGDGFYEGEWAEGRYHGLGYLLFSDNSSYSGGFVKGVAHGQGCETSADGTVRQGLWHNGRPKAQTES